MGWGPLPCAPGSVPENHRPLLYGVQHHSSATYCGISGKLYSLSVPQFLLLSDEENIYAVVEPIRSYTLEGSQNSACHMVAAHLPLGNAFPSSRNIFLAWHPGAQ